MPERLERFLWVSAEQVSARAAEERTGFCEPLTPISAVGGGDEATTPLVGLRSSRLHSGMSNTAPGSRSSAGDGLCSE